MIIFRRVWGFAVKRMLPAIAFANSLIATAAHAADLVLAISFFPKS
jgi:hypothetical protein